MRKLLTMPGAFIVPAFLLCLAACQRQMISKQDISANALAAVPPTGSGVGIYDKYTSMVSSIQTLAGTTFPGFGDGKDLVRFNAPDQMVLDRAGSLYIADMWNNRIRKMSPDGTVSTVAGTLVGGYKDGPVATAMFQSPTSVAIDSRGYIYVADMGNNRIRLITPDGMVSTLAGTGVAGFADGPGNVAKFKAPRGIALDAAGTLYVAEQGNNRIRRISPAGIVNVWVGDGVAGFKDGPGALSELNQPTSIVVGPGGVVYVADQGNNRIRKIVSGVMSTLAGSGVAGEVDGNGTGAQFYAPYGMAVDGLGNILVTDIIGARVREVSPQGVVKTLFGKAGRGVRDGFEWTGQVYFPQGIAIDTNGSVYLTDNNLLRKLTGVQGVRTIAGGKVGNKDGVGSDARFSFPYGLKIDGTGNIYISDLHNNNIRKITPAGQSTVLAGNPIESLFIEPSSIDGTGTAATFSVPAGITIDPNGNLFVCELKGCHIRKVTPAGVTSTIAGSGLAESRDGVGLQASFTQPADITRDAAGNLYVTDDRYLRKIDANGVVSTVFTFPQLPGGRIRRAQSIALGERGDLFVSAYYEGAYAHEYVYEIFKITIGGNATIFATFPQWWMSGGLTYDPAKHLLYSTEFQWLDAPGQNNFNSHILRFTANGQMSLLAGKAWISGDIRDGDLQTAELGFCAGLSLGPDGSLYFNDHDFVTSAGIRVLGMPK